MYKISNFSKLYFYVFATGNPLSPDDCWLTLRGMETLSVRLERQQENARILAENKFDRKNTYQEIIDLIYS